MTSNFSRTAQRWSRTLMARSLCIGVIYCCCHRPRMNDSQKARSKWGHLEKLFGICHSISQHERAKVCCDQTRWNVPNKRMTQVGARRHQTWETSNRQARDARKTDLDWLDSIELILILIFFVVFIKRNVLPLNKYQFLTFKFLLIISQLAKSQLLLLYSLPRWWIDDGSRRLDI